VDVKSGEGTADEGEQRDGKMKEEEKG